MILKVIKYLFGILSGIILILLVVFFISPLWRHWVTYPKLDRQISEFQKKRKEPQLLTKLKTYRGVAHAHSYLSHDSEGTLYDLTTAAKADGIDFIFLTDHPRYDLDTLPKGYHGNYDGVLIESGSEKQGFDCWPLDSTIINWKENKDSIAKNIVGKGGIIFYSHTEEPHNWANPDYQGMEIYNFHTDTKDENVLPHIFNFIVNGNKYRHWALREMFDEQTQILARWDSLNNHRKIVGFSAVDTHENQNYRARLLKDGRVQWVGPNAKIIDTVKVNFWNRWMFSQPDPDGWVFKFLIDTYPAGFNYITNYVLADTLSVPSISEAMKKGHLYTAFKSLGDAKGFLYSAINNDEKQIAILGDSVKIDEVKSLRAISPLPAEFRLICNGKPIHNLSGENYDYSWSGPFEKGAYRIEMYVKLNGKKVPWLYSNPIYLY